MKWTMAKGWLASTPAVNQICFGVEMVSTDDKEARFEVSAFSIEAKLRTKPNGVSGRAVGAMHSISRPYDEFALLDPFPGFELDEAYRAVATQRVNSALDVRALQQLIHRDATSAAESRVSF